ncbi:MAG: ABC transporter substrate-binding protein [Candidatus Binatia bacterium]
MKRKSFFCLSISSALLAALCLGVGSAPAQEKLRIPVAAPASTSSLVEQLAVYQGWFKELGYDARIYSVSGGESAAVLALEKGRLPFFNSDDNIALAIKPKSNIKVVASTRNKLLYYLVAGKHVKSYKDLPQTNIRVGISSPTSANVYVSLSLLEKNGIKNPRLIKVGGSSARLAAVKAGKVDVGSLTLGPMLKAKEAGLTILGSASEVTGEFLMMQVAMNKKWVEKNPKKAVEFVGTYIRGCEFINNPRNREKVIEVLTGPMKNKPKIAKAMYDINVVKEKEFPRYCQFTEKGIREYIKAAKWSKAIDPDLKVPPISAFTLPDLHKKGLAWYKKRYER